ncbi:MAG: hypothetical protein P8H35_05970 [Flavobacteriales bacterium]|nr:hypothetical protein [Flavobacteriales bacterium]
MSEDPSKVTVPPVGLNASSAAAVQLPAIVIFPSDILELLLAADS